MRDDDGTAESVEVQRLALEREKFAYQRSREGASDKAEARAKRWSQLSIVIPIVAIVLSFLTNASLERSKSAAASRQEQLRFDRDFIDRQLAGLYYPLRLRLEKDSAIWTLSAQLSEKARGRTTPEFSLYVEKRILLPNHDEAIKIVDKNLALLKNGRENYDPTRLMDALNRYQRHVAAYAALRASSNFGANPFELGEDAAFPRELPAMIIERIRDLERQRQTLSDELRGLER